MSVLGSGPHCEFILVSLMFGGLGGGLLFGGMTIGDNMNSGGNTMFLGMCWALPLGSALNSLFLSSVWVGTLSFLGVVFCFFGWVFGLEGVSA